MEQFHIRTAQDEDRLEQGMENAVGWTRREVELESAEALREKDKIIASRDRQITGLNDDLNHERECRGQARRDFQRARDERDELAAQIARMNAAIDAQKMALAVAEEFKKEAVAFRDEAAEHMNFVRQTKAKELADGRAAMEACNCQGPARESARPAQGGAGRAGQDQSGA